MSGADGIKFSVGAMVISIALGLYMSFAGDREHALMFFISSLLWAGNIFIWHKVKQRDEEENKP